MFLFSSAFISFGMLYLTYLSWRVGLVSSWSQIRATTDGIRASHKYKMSLVESCELGRRRPLLIFGRLWDFRKYLFFFLSLIVKYWSFNLKSWNFYLILSQILGSCTSQDGSQELSPAPEPIAWYGTCGWGRGRGIGRCRGRERARGYAQILDRVGSLKVELEVGDDDVGPSQAPPGFVAALIL